MRPQVGRVDRASLNSSRSSGPGAQRTYHLPHQAVAYFYHTPGGPNATNTRTVGLETRELDLEIITIFRSGQPRVRLLSNLRIVLEGGAICPIPAILGGLRSLLLHNACPGTPLFSLCIGGDKEYSGTLRVHISFRRSDFFLPRQLSK